MRNHILQDNYGERRIEFRKGSDERIVVTDSQTTREWELHDLLHRTSTIGRSVKFRALERRPVAIHPAGKWVLCIDVADFSETVKGVYLAEMESGDRRGR